MAWWAALAKGAASAGGASGGGGAAASGAAKGGAAAGGGGGGGEKKGGGGAIGSIIGRAKSDGNKPKQATMAIATGIIQQIQANKLRKKAEGAFPDMVDPNQAGYLAELGQKRKSIDTGADFAAGMNAIDTTNAGTNEALTKVTGGDATGTIQALLQSERTSADAKNNVLAQGQQQQLAYTQQYGDLLNQISNRKTQLQMQRSQQARAEWAQKQQAANQNWMVGITNATGGGAGTPIMGNPVDGNSQAQGQPISAPMSMPSSLQNPGLGVNTGAAQQAANGLNQKSTFGSSQPTMSSGVQQQVFGSTAGKSVDPNLLSSIRGGFKR